jgi:hypothetical protein
LTFGVTRDYPFAKVRFVQLEMEEHADFPRKYLMNGVALLDKSQLSDWQNTIK